MLTGLVHIVHVGAKNMRLYSSLLAMCYTFYEKKLANLDTVLIKTLLNVPRA